MDLKVSGLEQGASQAASRLGRLAQRLQGGGALLEAIAPLLAKQMNASFEAESDPSGREWPLLAASTIRDRRRKGYGDGPMLERTGAGKSGIRIEARGDVLQVVVPEVMGYHDRGEGVPQRRFVPTGDEFLAKNRADVVQAMRRFATPSVGQFSRGELRRSRRVIRGLLGR